MTLTGLTKVDDVLWKIQSSICQEKAHTTVHKPTMYTYSAMPKMAKVIKGKVF